MLILKVRSRGNIWVEGAILYRNENEYIQKGFATYFPFFLHISEL